MRRSLLGMAAGWVAWATCVAGCTDEGIPVDPTVNDASGHVGDVVEAPPDAVSGDAVDPADGPGDTSDPVDNDDVVAPPVVEWTADFLDLGEDFVLRGVWGADPSRIVAVGNKATILESTDDGWDVVHQNLELDTLNAVWGTSLNNVWAVGAHGAILHRDSTGWDIGTGCTNDAACDDSDPCTVDTCGTDGACAYVGSGQPGCCGTTLLDESWESGTLGGWQVTDTSNTGAGVVWQAAALTDPETGSPRATDGTWALYFGVVEQQNFDGGSGVQVAATATSGKLNVPAAAQVSVSFDVFIDAESSGSYDVVELRVITGAAGVPQTVWTKEDVGGATGNVFVPTSADLSAYAGTSIQLQFTFDSNDGTVNQGEGVFVDRLRLDTQCGQSAAGSRFPTLWDVWGTGPDDVYAVGNRGSILHYDGTSWKRQAGGEANDLFAVGGNGEHVVAAGAAGEVFATFGGGFSVDKAATSAAIRAVAVTPSSEAIGVGDGGTIVRYAGAGWEPVDSPTTNELHGAWADDTTVVAVGAAGTIVRRDGNGPFLVVDSGQSATLYDVWGTGPDDLLAVGEKGLLVRWDGTTWSKQGNLVSDELRSIHGFGADGPAVAVGGGGTIARLQDGVWAKDTSPTSFVLHGVWGAHVDDTWAVGNLGVIVHWDGSGWTEVESPTGLTLHEVWGRSANDVYAAGASGVLLHWDGAEWSVLRSNTTANLRAVWGLGPNDVYAVGAQATIMHFNGLNWSQIKVEDEVHDGNPQPVTDQLFDIWGTGPTDLWAVGNGGTLVHTEVDQTTGEVQWVKIPQADNAITVRAIVGEDADNLWLMGREGLVLHFDPPSTLTVEATSSIATLYDAVRFANGEIVAVGDLATVVRRGVFVE